MPALTRARESANRTACLSNLRQVHLGMTLYANQSKDRVPLGYWNGQKQISYLFHFNDSNKEYYSLLGLIHISGILKNDPKVYYCPSETHDWLMFNNDLN